LEQNATIIGSFFPRSFFPELNRIENCIHAIIVQLLQKLSTLAYFLIGNRQKLINYFRKSISINILDSQVLGIANEKIIKLKFDFHTSFNSYFF
jgi:hypothetical protein